MSKVILTLFITISAIIFLACDKSGSNANTPRNAANSAKPEVKTGVAPIADNEIAIIEMAEPAFGTIKIELYSNIAPKMVERFKTLAREGMK